MAEAEQLIWISYTLFTRKENIRKDGIGQILCQDALKTDGEKFGQRERIAFP